MRGHRSGFFTTRRIEETPAFCQRAGHHLVGRDHEVFDEFAGPIGFACLDILHLAVQQYGFGLHTTVEIQCAWLARAARRRCAAVSCKRSCACNCADSATFGGAAVLPSSHGPTPL